MTDISSEIFILFPLFTYAITYATNNIAYTALHLYRMYSVQKNSNRVGQIMGWEAREKLPLLVVVTDQRFFQLIAHQKRPVAVN